MNKLTILIALQYLTLQCLTAPSHSFGGYGGGGGSYGGGGGGHGGGGGGGGGYGGGHGGGGKNHGPLMATPNVASYRKISYAKGKLIDLGEYTKGEYPEQVIQITKTYAIKVPQPYPVKIKQNVPVPYPVAHPYPVTVPRIVKVPHPVPVEVIKKVEVPVHSTQSHYSLTHENFANQDNSGGYSASNEHSAAGHPGLQLVNFKYNQHFGGGIEDEQQHLGSGAESVYQQQDEQSQQYAAYPTNIMQQQQQQQYGQVEVSHHGIQDGVDGYSIHTVSMNVPQKDQTLHQREAPEGESYVEMQPIAEQHPSMSV